MLNWYSLDLPVYSFKIISTSYFYDSQVYINNVYTWSRFMRKVLIYHPWMKARILLQILDGLLVIISSSSERLWCIKRTYQPRPKRVGSWILDSIADFWKEALILSSLHLPNVLFLRYSP